MFLTVSDRLAKGGFSIINRILEILTDLPRRWGRLQALDCGSTLHAGLCGITLISFRIRYTQERGQISLKTLKTVA